MKVHVRKGTGNNCDNIPVCAMNARHYKHLPNEFVKSPKEFRQAASEDRCQHCMDLYLINRNKQRKAKGLPPVATAFEGLDAE